MRSDLLLRWKHRVRCLGTAGLAALGLAACLAPKAAFAGPPIGINLSFTQDWSGQQLFADAFKEAREWDTSSGGAHIPASQLDANGWPQTDAYIYLWAGQPNDNSGTYALSFNGQATIVGATISNQAYNSGTNTTTATLTESSPTAVLQIGFTNSKRTAASGTNTGITNVKLMRPTVPGGSTSYATNVTFTNSAKNLYAKFQVLRMMDYSATNGNSTVNWSARTRPGWFSQATGWEATYPAGSSWEYAVQFCNETGKDLWINVPVSANDDYVTKLAQLVQFGSDGTNPYTSAQGSPVYAPLSAGLKVYVEFSNEVWNTGFQQASDNHAAAVAEVNAGGSPLNFDGGTSDWDWAAHRTAKRTVEISNIFRTIFGSAAMMSRVRPVLESQQGYTTFWLMGQSHMLEDYYNNPSKVASPHPPSYYIYGGGGAGYYGPDNSSDTLTINNIWTSGTFDATAFATGEQSDADYALALYGKRTAYEGGPSMDNVGHSEAVKAQAWGDNRMTGIVTGHQIAWNQLGGDVLVYFDGVSDYQWGFTHDVNVLNTPKLIGVDQINTSTQATGNYGIAVPCTIPSGNYLAPATWAGANPSSMAAGGNWTWTTYTVSTASAIALTVGLSAGSAGTGNQGDVYVDGVLAGTIAIPNTGGNGTFANSPTVTSAVLPTGTHSVMVKAKAGSFGFNSVIVSSGGGGSAPPVPTGLTATAGNTQVALSWNASSGATAYDVKRSTINGSGYVAVNSPATTSYTNTGLTNGTTYYFVVDAKNASGTSANSSQASATPAGAIGGLVKINAGGPASAPFIADVDFSGGTAFTNWTGAIDTSAVTNPAPQAVYQSERYSSPAMSYTIPGLTAGTTYQVRLHLCENFFTASGQRVFSVALNGTTVLTNFDIFATAGAIHKANIQQFNVAANGSGQIVVAFTNVTNNALVNGIEINAAGGSAPPAPTGLTATPGNAQVALSWSVSTGATAYDVKRSTTSGSGYATVSSPTATSYTNTGLTNGTTYYFVVDAKNANGTSANSAQVSATPFATITNGLKGWWKFDETSGTVASDSSGNAVNGAVTAGTWVAGKFGNALSFNGTSSFVDVGDPAALNFAGQITVSTWVKPTAIASESIVLGHGWDGISTPWWLSLTDTTHVRFGHNGPAVVTADGAAASSMVGAWHLVTGVYDGTAYRIYLDGVLLASTSSTSAPGTGTTSIRIGAINEGTPKFFNGLIDDARIYNRALSAAEILSIFNGNG